MMAPARQAITQSVERRVSEHPAQSESLNISKSKRPVSLAVWCRTVAEPIRVFARRQRARVSAASQSQARGACIFWPVPSTQIVHRGGLLKGR